MNSNAVQMVKNRIWRRIIVKSVVCGLWAIGMLYVALRGGAELADGTYLCMAFAIVAVWAISTIRDVRRLHNESALRKAAIEETDERNVLISYKATRLAVTIMACLLPIALFVLAYLDMQDAINTLGYATCLFLVAYMTSWFIIAKRS